MKKAISMARTLLLNASMSNQKEPDRKLRSDVNDNVGNAYITYSVAKMFGLTEDNCHFVNLSNYPSSIDNKLIPEEINNFDKIFIIMQDHFSADIFSGSDDWYNFLASYLLYMDPGTQQIVVLSLSANSYLSFEQPFDRFLYKNISPARMRFFRILSEHSTVIGVRDEYTAEQLSLSAIHNFAVVGCPSYFEAGPDRMVTNSSLNDRSKLFGTNGVPGWTAMIECHFYMQGDADWVITGVVYGQEHSADDEWRAVMLQEPHMGVIRAVANGTAHFFYSFDAWKRHIAENCRAVFGSRLHGCIVGLNAGVPCINTSADSRSRASCDYLGIPSHPGGLVRANSLDIIEAFSKIDLEVLNATYAKRYMHFKTWCHDLKIDISHDKELNNTDPFKKTPSAKAIVSLVRAMNNW